MTTLMLVYDLSTWKGFSVFDNGIKFNQHDTSFLIRLLDCGVQDLIGILRGQHVSNLVYTSHYRFVLSLPCTMVCFPLWLGCFSLFGGMKEVFVKNRVTRYFDVAFVSTLSNISHWKCQMTMMIQSFCVSLFCPFEWVKVFHWKLMFWYQELVMCH